MNDSQEGDHVLTSADAGHLERTYIGGLWSAGDSAIWPLARLDLFDWGIGVRQTTRVLGWMISPWQTWYEEIASAQRIFIPVASRGVRIRTRSEESIVFWSRRDHDILNHL